MANCFLSHATVDRAAAEELKRLLEARRHRVFLDTDHDDGIQPGEVWETRLQRELRIANTVIFLNSEAAQRSKWCHYEMLRAKELDKRILPVDVAAGVAPYALIGSFQGIRGVSLAANGERMIETLDEWDEPTWDPDRVPYPGLFAFEQDDEAVFFGRDDDVRQLVSLVAPDQPASGQTILMMGPSGVGKSSLLCAGLAPRLACHSGWRLVGPFSPGRDPRRELHRLLDLDTADPGGRGALAERARRIAAKLERPGRLLVAIDQAEELLQPDTDQTSRERLVTELQAATMDQSPVTVVISFREDRLAEMKTILPAFFETGLTPTQVVNRLPQDRLAELVEGPARVAGLDLAPGLLGRLAEEATGDDDDKLHALPLIAFTLGEMYHRATADGRHELTMRDYEDAGRFEGAIRQAAQQMERNLTADGLAALDTLLPKLVTVAENGAVGARTVLLNDLDPAEAAVAQKLSDKRLLNISQAQGETDAAARLVHDRLVTDWPRIKTIVDTTGDDLRLLSRFRRQADEFATNQRDVLTADATSDASEWLKRQPETPDLAGVRAYVDTSRATHRRRRRRRRGALAMIMLAAAAAVWFGIDSRNAAVLARANAAADRALALLADGQHRSAAEAAYESVNLRWTNKGEDALRLALGPLGKSRQLEDTPFNGFGVAFSPDGTKLATAGYDGTATVWDIATGQPRATLNLDAGPIVEVAFSPDGTKVATGGSEVYVWDVASGEHRKIESVDNIVNRVAFSPDGTELAAATSITATAGTATRVTTRSVGTAMVWDVATGQARATLTPPTFTVETGGILNAVAFSPDGTELAAASDDRTAIVWEIATGQPHTTLSAHTGPVTAVVFSPDGTELATASNDGTAIVWDAATGQVRSTLTARSGPVVEVAFSTDGTRLSTATAEGMAIVWDVATGQRRSTFDANTGQLFGVAFSPDGTKLATASLAGGAIVWDLPTRHPGSRRATLTAHTDGVTGVAFSPDGTVLATASRDGTAIVWDAASGQPNTTLSAHTGPVTAVVFSPDGAELATASDDGTAIVWDVTSGQPRRSLRAHTGAVVGVAFSPDGTQLATASHDGTAIVWDLATGQPRAKLTDDTGPVNGVAFRPDGSQLATASRERTRAVVWDLATRQPRTTMTPANFSSVVGVAFSADGTKLATAGPEGEAIVWDVATRQQRIELTDPDLSAGDFRRVATVAFSADGTKLATASSEETAIVWDIGSGEPRTTLRAHTGAVNGVAFSPDGTKLATASNDRTAIIWTAVDLLTRDELKSRAEELLG